MLSVTIAFDLYIYKSYGPYSIILILLMTKLGAYQMEF
jgi:hypothetical protein